MSQTDHYTYDDEPVTPHAWAWEEAEHRDLGEEDYNRWLMHGGDE